MLDDLKMCFACGLENKCGLHLNFDYTFSGAQSYFVLDEKFQGYPDFAHGGIVTTILDEAMAHTLMHHKIMAVTASLEVRFKKPVPLGEELLVKAILADSFSKKRFKLRAVVENKGGQILAEAKALFIALKTL